MRCPTWSPSPRSCARRSPRWPQPRACRRHASAAPPSGRASARSPRPDGYAGRPMRVALCQINATVGDIAGNATQISEGIERARVASADLVLFPELAITGYPPEDLLLRAHFLDDARAALEQLAGAATGIVAIVGFPERAQDVYNAAAVLAEGRVHAVYRKNYLPNY